MSQFQSYAPVILNCDSEDEPPGESTGRRVEVIEQKEWKNHNEAESPHSAGKYNPSGVNGPLGVEIKANVSFSWVNPKLCPRMCTTGSGMYAMQDVTKGEHLVVWTGKIITAEEGLKTMETEDRHYLLQIGDGFYQIPLSTEREAADWTNHSCEPNAGFGKGSPICLSAMRDIKAGEQVCFDYGMCETDERLWEAMDCMCGTKACRKSIDVYSWKREDLREKYKGYWAPHVQALIDADIQAKKEAAEREKRALAAPTEAPATDITEIKPVQVAVKKMPTNVKRARKNRGGRARVQR